MVLANKTRFGVDSTLLLSESLSSVRSVLISCLEERRTAVACRLVSALRSSGAEAAEPLPFPIFFDEPTGGNGAFVESASFTFLFSVAFPHAQRVLLIKKTFKSVFILQYEIFIKQKFFLVLSAEQVSQHEQVFF